MVLLPFLPRTVCSAGHVSEEFIQTRGSRGGLLPCKPARLLLALDLYFAT